MPFIDEEAERLDPDDPDLIRRRGNLGVPPVTGSAGGLDGAELAATLAARGQRLVTQEQALEETARRRRRLDQR